MKRKKIQYNELTQEIYNHKHWNLLNFFIFGLILFILGFSLNFPLETKVTKWVTANLLSNEQCPVIFDKIEVSYFLPQIIITNPVIQGVCFGQKNNKLPLESIKIALHSPSFYPLGLKLSATIVAHKTNIHIYPIISPFSQYIEIENSQIDPQVFAAMTSDNLSPIGGMINIEGFVKISSGNIEDGQLNIKSNRFHFPAQNIKGFEMKSMILKHFNIQTHFTNKTNMQIDRIEIGKNNMPLNIKLKGSLQINQRAFGTSLLMLSGTLQVTDDVLTNFPFLKLFLPSRNTNNTYHLKLNGPINNLGPPQFD